MEAIYDKLGQGYDTTRNADPEILSTLGKLLRIESDKNYLDVACGTGNDTTPLSELAGNWHACDGSEKMLSDARLKSMDIKWRQSDVSDLIYDTAFFDGAICTLAIHHFPELRGPFGEIGRVLKSGGHFVIFTSTPEQMEGYWLNHYFPVMMKKSCEQMPALEAVVTALQQAGFLTLTTEPFFITPELKDFFLYSGKHRPGMYLSRSVRNGMSAFHNFCSKPEIEAGLNKLKMDIASGEINAVMERYENSNGDYMFICAAKR